MISLYWRIFLAFWVTIALILICTVLLVLNAEQQRRFSHSWVQRSTLYAQATHAFESGGADALGAWLRNLQPPEIRALTFITDSSGQEMLGRAIPDYLRDPNYLRDPSTPVSATNAHRILQPTIRSVGGPLVLVGPDGRAFHVIVGPLRAGPHLFGELELPQVSMATLGIALVVSALVCFILARYLVAPVDQLRRATRQIASGDLAVRVSPKLKGRRDELGLLASDLDTMSERVRNLLETKQQLLRDVSHELRSPLARLQLALSLARRDGDAESARHHERIACEADRLEELIARTLTLARIERPARGLERLPVNVSELLARIVSDVGIEADAQGCTVDLQSAADLFVEGDWELLRSALENVIRNAVRYSPPGASVAVSAHLSRGQLEVVVRDGGPGVPEKDLALIFEPFYRVDAARNRAGGGDGLGLAIASRAIALHGGTIDASNISSGGLAVRMLLPVIHSGAHATVLEPPAAPPMEDLAQVQDLAQVPGAAAEGEEKAALASGSPTVL
ncbi:MAG: HAMP domain-containing protein [Sinobacteraceae bacterium]|nr:HAMP domain-containing protein [Nevskiaceae bacterium]